jgi:hypothetical protein
MWPIEIKDVEKRVIVDDMNRCSMWTVARRPCLLTYFTHIFLRIIRQGSVPLLLGLVTYCTLVYAFGGLERGRRCEIRHGRRVSVEYVEY